MQVKILKEKLEKGLEIATRISLRKPSLPILSNVLLETEKNFLKISSTNLETGLIYKSLAKIEKEGKTCVEAKFFLSVISSLKEDIVEMSLENSTLLIKGKKISLKIKTQNPEEFPIIPKRDSLEKITLDSEVLVENLRKLINIPSPSLGKPEISGILLNFEKENLKLVATDSFRLAEKKISLKNPLSKSYSLILPQSASKEIIGIFGAKTGMVDFYLTPNQIFIEKTMEEVDTPEIVFTSRLIEGEYPNYQEIIPKKFKTQIILDKETFLDQIKTASLFSGRINEVRLKIFPKEKKLEILSQNPELGEYKSEIETEIEGTEIDISFNYRFLIDGILSIEEKKINFLFTDREGPAILKPQISEDYFYILMPIKSA